MKFFLLLLTTYSLRAAQLVVPVNTIGDTRELNSYIVKELEFDLVAQIELKSVKRISNVSVSFYPIQNISNEFCYLAAVSLDMKVVSAQSDLGEDFVKIQNYIKLRYAGYSLKIALYLIKVCGKSFYDCDLELVRGVLTEIVEIPSIFPQLIHIPENCRLYYLDDNSIRRYLLVLDEKIIGVFSFYIKDIKNKELMNELKRSVIMFPKKNEQSYHIYNIKLRKILNRRGFNWITPFEIPEYK
jgi:hypothetical protein